LQISVFLISLTHFFGFFLKIDRFSTKSEGADCPILSFFLAQGGWPQTSTRILSAKNPAGGALRFQTFAENCTPVAHNTHRTIPGNRYSLRMRTLQGAERLNYVGFVTGHDFSCADKANKINWL
jgi:hypothetical protein